MEVVRKKNYEGIYDYTFKEKDKRLEIFFAGNLDLYMILRANRLIGEENISMFFDITKEDYEIFSIFDSLYQEVINGEIFEDSKLDYRRSFAYSRLVDSDNNINWVSDDGPVELEDKMKITKLDGDTYRLIFERNDSPLIDGFKNSTGICIRFRNSGSTYDPFNCCFMRMYRRLQEVDPEYHQYHIEEMEYIKKKTLSK